MHRPPPLRVAEVFRVHWREFCATHAVAPHPARVVRHLLLCRTAALGGHRYRCDACGAEVTLYNSCRDRHCPTCQTLRKQQWLEARRAELLPVPYFHVVFTLPHRLNPLVRANRARLFGVLFAAAREVLQAFAADPQWKLQGQLGYVAVLHTWTQKLLLHPHLHCLVPGGAWDARAQRWTSAHRRYLFGKRALAKAFQARFIQRLQALRCAGKLTYAGAATALAEPAAWAALIGQLWQTPWVVYPKATAQNTEQTLDYLARYTHRVAISDHRILRVADGQVTFAWRDRADGNRLKTETLAAADFIGRFLLHILPAGFAKVRHFGWLAARHKRTTLAAIRATLQVPPPTLPPADEAPAERIRRLTGVDVTRCPLCARGRLTLIVHLPPSRAGP